MHHRAHREQHETQQRNACHIKRPAAQQGKPGNHHGAGAQSGEHDGPPPDPVGQGAGDHHGQDTADLHRHHHRPRFQRVGFDDIHQIERQEHQQAVLGHGPQARHQAQAQNRAIAQQAAHPGEILAQPHARFSVDGAGAVAPPQQYERGGDGENRQ